MSNELPITREDLPVSLFAARRVSYPREKVDAMARQPQRLQDVPSGYTPSIERRMKSLAQYKGRSLEGQRNAFTNLRHRKQMLDPEEQPIELPANIPQPAVPMIVPAPKQIHTQKMKYLRACMAQDEVDLYKFTWREWMTAHPEYQLPEDIHDIETICMETVIQFRLDIFKQRWPSRDCSNEYNQSFRRAQQARENLEARRTDRNSAKGKGNMSIGNINIAVMASQMDEKKVLALNAKALEQRNTDFDQLEMTKDSIGQLEAINRETIEAKVVKSTVVDPEEHQ